MGHDHRIRNAHNVPLHHVIPKSLMSRSFPTICPSASEIVGLLG